MPDVRAAVAARQATQEAQEVRHTNLASWVESDVAPQIAAILPKHLSGERMGRLLLSAARRNADLLKCDPQSMAGSILTCAVLGLEPNTPTGEAYLIPRNARGQEAKECTLVVGYQGYVKLFWQHPLAAGIDAEAAYPGDHFEWAKGTRPFLEYRPRPDQRPPNADPGHYWAAAQLTNGATPFVVLTAAEVRTLREGKEGPSGQIADPQRWMERKTALRQLLKLLPKSPLLATAVASDEVGGRELYKAAKAERVTNVPPAALPPGQEDSAGGPDAWPAVPTPGGAS